MTEKRVYPQYINTLTIEKVEEWTEFFGIGYEVENGRIAREVNFETGETVVEFAHTTAGAIPIIRI